MESQPCRNSHIIYWFSLGEAYMVIKRVSSNQMPLNQLIRGSLKYNPPPRPPSPMFNQRPQPGWEVPNNSLSAIVSYWVHKTGSLAGREGLHGREVPFWAHPASPGPTSCYFAVLNQCRVRGSKAQGISNRSSNHHPAAGDKEG